MSNRTYKLISWVVFTLVLILCLLANKKVIQETEQQDYLLEDLKTQNEYLESQVSHFYSETVRLRAEIRLLESKNSLDKSPTNDPF